MKLIFTGQAASGLNECLDFLAPKVSPEKLIEVRDAILSKVDLLLDNPLIGQQENYLEHLRLGHRRVIEGNYKVIYRVEGDLIIVTDIFDSRQDPDKMKC